MNEMKMHISMAHTSGPEPSSQKVCQNFIFYYSDFVSKLTDILGQTYFINNYSQSLQISIKSIKSDKTLFIAASS